MLLLDGRATYWIYVTLADRAIAYVRRMDPRLEHQEAVDDVLVDDRRKQLIAEGAVLGGVLGVVVAFVFALAARLGRQTR